MYTNSEWQHLISSCLQLCVGSSIKYSMVLGSRYPDASVVVKYTHSNWRHTLHHTQNT